MRTAGILIVGDEVLSGEVRDANGPFLIARLSSLGSRVVRLVAVPDREDEIVRELQALRGAADAVIVAGGIGPTHDDLTRPAVARAVGVPIERHAEAEAHVHAWYGERTTAAELTMADLPRGSRLLRGATSTSLGFCVAGVYVLPGVPSLLRDLVEGMAAEFTGAPLHKEEIHTDLREGQIADPLGRIQAAALDVAIGSYPSIGADGRWHTRIVVRSPDAARAAAVAHQVRTAFTSIG